MKRLILASVFALGFVGSASAQTADSSPITETIQNQIEAFKMDDFARAFEYASPNIRGLFGTPERFGMMVQNGYPMVWRPADVEFLSLRQRMGRIVQRVQIRDAQGELHQLDYFMIQTGDTWHINGVQMVRIPGVGA